MNFANVRLKEHQLIDPHLVPFVEKLVLDNPNLVLVGDTQGWSSAHSVMGDVEAPDNKRFVARFVVKHGATDEMLGHIGVKRRYKSRGPDEMVYFVNSWRIDNKRGASNTSATTKLTGALRVAKRALMPRAYDEVYEQGMDTIDSHFDSALRQLGSSIGNGFLLPNGGIRFLQSYVYKQVNGFMISKEMQATVTETFTSEKYKRAMEEFGLAEKMRDYKQLGRLVFLIEHNNGYLFKDKEGQFQCHAFDELPEWLQNHVGVLLLMQDGELVNDVGFRQQQGRYLVVSP